MKKLFLAAVLFSASMIASAQVTPLAPRSAAAAQANTQNAQPSQVDNPNAPVFKFETITHDFGNVPEGPPAVFEYVFTNTGREPLIISDVVKSCGCTTPSWTKEPILPGKTGKIVASFDTKNRVGNFNKTLTVVSNAKQPNFQLTFGGVVVAAPPTTQENSNIQEIKLEPQPH